MSLWICDANKDRATLAHCETHDESSSLCHGVCHRDPFRQVNYTTSERWIKFIYLFIIYRRFASAELAQPRAGAHNGLDTVRQAAFRARCGHGPSAVRRLVQKESLARTLGWFNPVSQIFTQRIANVLLKLFHLHTISIAIILGGNDVARFEPGLGMCEFQH